MRVRFRRLGWPALLGLLAVSALGCGNQTLLSTQPQPGSLPEPPAFPFDEATAQRYQREYAARLGRPLELVNVEGLTLVLIPPGTFLMGSPDDEPGHNGGGYEDAQHTVTLTRPFYLGKHEVTVAQFRAFVTATGYV